MISNYDLFAIHNSRIENMNSLFLNSNKINYNYEKSQKEIVALKNVLLNLKRSQDKTNKILISLVVFIILIMIIIILLYFLFLKK